MEKTYRYNPTSEFPWQYKYEHMAVTTDCVIFTFDERVLKILLIQRGIEPFKGKWALPGGFLRCNETAEAGARRELFEETGLEASRLGEIGVFSTLGRDPRERVITIAWYALVKHSLVRGGDDAENAEWVPLDKLEGLDLAFDHSQIIQAALSKLREEIYFHPVGFDLLDFEFTMPELQALYETILGQKFDRRNFQRKIITSQIVEEVKEVQIEDHRMAHMIDYSCHAVSLMLGNNNHLYEDDIESERCVEKYCVDEACKDIALAEEKKSTKGKIYLKRSPGRIATRFRFNSTKYVEMKKDGEGKTEF